MANRYPLVVNTATSRIAELPAGDNLDLSSSNISNVGNISVSGNIDVTANVSAAYYFGDGSQLTGIVLTPGGTSGQLQFNNSGSFDGVPNVTYNSGNLSLGSVANVKVTGGTSGQVLVTDGAGNLTFANAGGISYRLKPVRVATTDGITLSGTQTIDGVALSVGDRVLVWRQGTPADNGIYEVQTGAWTRTTDFTTGSDTLIGGVTVTVVTGTYFSGVDFYCTNTTAITIGTTAINFQRSMNTGLISIWTAAGTFQEQAKGALNSGSMGIGLSANASGTDSVAIGYAAKTTNQGVALGYSANTLGAGTALGWNTRGVQNGVAIGAGANANGVGSTAIGNGALAINSTGIAIGNTATAGGTGAIAIGFGTKTSNSSSISIGIGSGATGQFSDSIAIGANAATTNQNQYAIAIGAGAGTNAQATMSMAFGVAAGYDQQGANAIAMGRWAGRTTQGANSIAIGLNAGSSAQGINAVAIGFNSSNTSQGANSISIGTAAGMGTSGLASLGIDSIAIGKTSSASGASSVAIGPNAQATASNSIVLNATAAGLGAGTANAFYVKPIRTVTSPGTNFKPLYYDPTTGELVYVA